MNKTGQWIAITAGCVAVYVGLRMLPVESCEFLHYGKYVDANGVIEGCGYEETSFFDLTALRFPILVELVPDRDPVAGEAVFFTLMLKTTTGRAIDYEDIAVTHTERLHALIVDESMEDYQHIHPQPGGPRGHYHFEMTPNKSGEYRMYLDFIPLINNRRTLLSAKFSVGGDSSESRPRVSGSAMASTVSNWGGHQFELAIEGDSLRTGKDFEMELKRVEQGEHAPKFEPVMGAYAHLVAFDEAGRGFVHLHPMNPFVQEQDPFRPDMRFQMQLDQPGHYRVWAQLRIEGEDVFLPFDLYLES